MRDDRIIPRDLPDHESRGRVMDWLREEDPHRLDLLWSAADAVRAECVGDEVHLRGLIEISNCCVRQCAYCGLRSGNAGLDRYRMEADEVLACAGMAAAFGFGTVVLQGGEDYGLSTDWVAELIMKIKRETGLAVTLSLGERPGHELRAWREAGADRYLLRFETSDRHLYGRIHPSLPSRNSDRIELIRELGALGYETGSGVMVGIPGQTYQSLADDILLFRALDLDMIGIGPYIPNPLTPMGNGRWESGIRPRQQVPNSASMASKVVALARLLCPEANIPATTALATLDTISGYELGLKRGANVIMPNLTPAHYRARYEIYPKQQLLSDSNSTTERIFSRIELIGRTIGKGPGNRIRRNCRAHSRCLPPTSIGERHEQYQGTH